MKYNEQNRNASGGGKRASEEPFAQVPEIFLQELSEEQYKSRLQIYQTAYERAAQAAKLPKPFVPPFEFELKDGI